MEEAIQDFCAEKTILDLTQLALISAKSNLELLYQKQDSIKQTLPLDEKNIQIYTDMINFSLEVVFDLENILQKQLQMQAEQ
jgi:hypothetical protein